MEITTKTGIWIIYLRKSRQDDPNQTVAQVLAKHEEILQEYARRELGGEIADENIYREVVSGESIADREEIQKVLARLEDPKVLGVLVVEPSRLSRGDLGDCSKIITAFRFSRSLVVTPMMTYDLENKMERKFFQDELLRGNDYLEYTKEILFRGRVAAVKRGCYINLYPPYGYDKVKRGDDHTLEPNGDAYVVQLIFKWYTEEQLTPFRIAQRLNTMGLKAPRGEEWKKDTIRSMLRNIHYAGKVRFNYIRTTQVMEYGEVVKKRLKQSDEDIIIAEGKHPAILDWETWEKAQELVARNPRIKHEYELKNPLSGVVKCSKCGKALHIHPYEKADDRFECRTRPRCFKSVQASVLMEAVLTALEQAELPELKAKVKSNAGDAAEIQKKLLEKLEKEMEEYRRQEDKQYELLEKEVYSQDRFEQRNAALRSKMEACQEAIYKAKSSMPKSVDYSERVVALEQAIAALRDTDMKPVEKNKIIKAIVDRIEYTGTPSIDHTKRKGMKRGHNPFTLEVFLKL